MSLKSSYVSFLINDNTINQRDFLKTEWRRGTNQSHPPTPTLVHLEEFSIVWLPGPLIPPSPSFWLERGTDRTDAVEVCWKVHSSTVKHIWQYGQSWCCLWNIKPNICVTGDGGVECEVWNQCSKLNNEITKCLRGIFSIVSDISYFLRNIKIPVSAYIEMKGIVLMSRTISRYMQASN